MMIINEIPSQDENVLTMAFVNIQPFSEGYEAQIGFPKGTIFPDLDKPLKAGGAR